MNDYNDYPVARLCPRCLICASFDKCYESETVVYCIRSSSSCHIICSSAYPFSNRCDIFKARFSENLPVIDILPLEIP